MKKSREIINLQAEKLQALVPVPLPRLRTLIEIDPGIPDDVQNLQEVLAAMTFRLQQAKGLVAWRKHLRTVNALGRAIRYLCIGQRRLAANRLHEEATVLEWEDEEALSDQIGRVAWLLR